jgi:integrase
MSGKRTKTVPHTVPHKQENVMERNKLTDRYVASLKPADKEYKRGDGNGLYIRVRAEGAKSWLLVYGFGGKRRTMQLGAYPTISLSAARKMTQEAQEAKARGEDPKVLKMERMAEAEAKLKAEKAARDRMTVSQLFEVWVENDLVKRKDKGQGARRSFGKDVLPKIGETPVEDVTRGQIMSLLEGVAKRAPIVAREMAGNLRQMWGYGIRKEIAKDDPTARLKKDDFGRKKMGERVLEVEEIRALAGLLPKARMQEASIAAIWIMLATCCRVGEISQARWKDVNFEAGVWVIPAENAKNGKAHRVVLSDFAKARFQELARLNEGRGSQWVLPASKKDGDEHIYLKSLTKQIGGRQRSEKSAGENRSSNTSALELEGGRWTPHDLRRTGATLMRKLKVSSDTIEKCLNHVETNKLKRIYQRDDLEDEQAEAWRLLGARIEVLVSGGGNVVVVDFRSAA